MRRITLWLFSTVAALVLLFSYRTSMNQGGTAPAAATAGAPVGGATPTPTASTATPAPSTSSKTSTSSGTKTYSGSVAQTQWGPVQVTITVTNAKITDVALPTYPNGNRWDEEINAYALPVLR